MCCVNMKAIWRLDPWLCGLEFLTFIWIDYNFLGWGLWFRPFFKQPQQLSSPLSPFEQWKFCSFLKNVCGNSREKWKESTRKRNSFGYPLITVLFSHNLLIWLFSLFNEKFEPFWKKRPGQTTSGGHPLLGFK